jgi:ribosome-binding factor A
MLIGSVTIVNAELNEDGSVVSCYVEEKKVQELNRKSGQLRYELAKKIKLRFVPRIVFLENKGEKNYNRVEELLAEIHKHDGKANNGEDKKGVL